MPSPARPMLSRLKRSKAEKKELDLEWKCFNEQRYSEAKQQLRQSVQDREKILGEENVDTLNSKY